MDAMTTMRLFATALLAAAIALVGCNGQPSEEEPAGTQASPTVETTTPEPTETAQPTPEPTATGDAEVEIEDFEFQPAEITVAPGTAVVWKQRDDVPHTATADDGAFDSGTLGDREEFTQVFDEPGTYTYFCEVHPFMTGTVVVG